MSYQVYLKTAEKFSSTLVSELVGTAFVWWLAGVWRMGALLLFGAFVVLTLLDALQVAALVATGAVVDVISRREQRPIPDNGWMWAGTGVRVVGVAVAGGLLWLLFRRLWGAQ